MQLIFGAQRTDRRVVEVERLLLAYRSDSGSEYLDYQARTPAEELVPEDLAVTTLINSRFTMAAFRSLASHGDQIDLRVLPAKHLEDTTSAERRHVAEVIATLAQRPGFAASVATKVLHKKRPDLIPILDNQAIFGAYMNPRWPEQRSLTDSVKSETRINEALDWIAFDLTRPENLAAWATLEEIEPSRSRIQLFDSIWWMHFREVEPVTQPVTQSPNPTEDRTSTSRHEGDIVIFVDDESGYLAWVAEHPSGYVLNSDRNPRPAYLKLHRASCGRISGIPPRGSTWTTPYMKVCAENRGVIENWALDRGGGSTSPCRWCSPDQAD